MLIVNKSASYMVCEDRQVYAGKKKKKKKKVRTGRQNYADQQI